MVSCPMQQHLSTAASTPDLHTLTPRRVTGLVNSTPPPHLPTDKHTNLGRHLPYHHLHHGDPALKTEGDGCLGLAHTHQHQLEKRIISLSNGNTP